jgi:hypothetical protein
MVKRRTLLASLAVAPAIGLSNEHAAADADDAISNLSFFEWLILHPGARELHLRPGWVYASEGPDHTGGPFWRLHVRNRDGREFDFAIDMYLREVNGIPWNTSFDWPIQRELHERWPDEYAAPEAVDWVEQWPPSAHLSTAFDALVMNDFRRYEASLRAAAEAMGYNLEGVPDL